MVAVVYILFVLIPVLQSRPHQAPAARLRLHAACCTRSRWRLSPAHRPSAGCWPICAGPDIVSGWIERLRRHRRPRHHAAAGRCCSSSSATSSTRCRRSSSSCRSSSSSPSSGNINPAAHGRGDHHHAGLRPDHAALRAVAADGVEIRRRAASPTRCSDRCRSTSCSSSPSLLRAVPRRRALAAEAPAAGIGRLLQEPERDRLHLPEVLRPMPLQAAPTLGCRGPNTNPQQKRTIIICRDRINWPCILCRLEICPISPDTHSVSFPAEKKGVSDDQPVRASR